MLQHYQLKWGSELVESLAVVAGPSNLEKNERRYLCRLQILRKDRSIAKTSIVVRSEDEFMKEHNQGVNVRLQPLLLTPCTESGEVLGMSNATPLFQLRWISIKRVCVGKPPPHCIKVNGVSPLESHDTKDLFLCRRRAQKNPSVASTSTNTYAQYATFASQRDRAYEVTFRALERHDLAWIHFTDSTSRTVPSSWEVLQAVADPYVRDTSLTKHIPSPPSTRHKNTAPLETMFALERPRSVISGVWSGIKNISLGVTGGLTSFIASPIIAGRRSGTTGALKGFGQGLATGTVLGVLGCLAGATQVLRGVVNTPQAVKQYVRPTMTWDHHRGQWCKYDLLEENRRCSLLGDVIPEILKQAKQRSLQDFQQERKLRSPSPGNCVDPTLYETLGISPAATSAELRTAYMKGALEFHPDRNMSNNHDFSKGMFQRINEAYQILSCPDLRERYNREGVDAVRQTFQQRDEGVVFT